MNNKKDLLIIGAYRHTEDDDGAGCVHICPEPQELNL